MFNQLTLDNLTKIAGILFTISISAEVLYGIYKLNQKGKEIFGIKNQIDNIDSDEISKKTLSSGMVNQSQFEKMTEKRRKPLEAKLETLKMERQFFLDKIPLLGWFRK